MAPTPLSRRHFLTSTAAISLLGALPRTASASQPATPTPLPAPLPPPFFTWEEVAPGITIAYPPAGAPGAVPSLGGNSTLLSGDTSAALIDTKYPALAAALRREAALLGKPLSTVINTHHHADHTGGNLAFTPDLPVLAHPNAIPRVLAQLKRYVDGLPGMAATLTKMEGEAAKPVAAEAQDLAKRAADLKADQFAPTGPITLDSDLDLAGFKARAIHPGPAHTDNDIAIHLPGANFLIAGDLVFSHSHAVLDRPSGGTSAGWIKAIGALLVLCDDKTIVIPGHGRHGDRSLLTAQANYLQTLRDLMSKAVRDGIPRADAIKTAPPEAFKDFGLQQVYPLTLGAIYDEVEADAAAANPSPAPPAPPK